MSELASFEQRLIAALDRIDYSLDMGAHKGGDQAVPKASSDGLSIALGAALESENAALRAQLETAMAALPKLSEMGAKADKPWGNDAIATITADEAQNSATDDCADAGPTALQERLEDTEIRLSAATREAARLAAANDALIRANRDLMVAASSDDKVAAMRDAMEAEAESLRAARQAEIAQMGDVLSALEQLLARHNVAQTDASDPSAATSADQEE